jgi:hypothetical protein
VAAGVDVVAAGVDVVAAGVAGADAVVAVPGAAVPAAADGVNVKVSWNCTGNGQPVLLEVPELEPELGAPLSLEEVSVTPETPWTRRSCTIVWATTD